MPKMTKSPSQFTRVAYENAKKALPEYSHPKSPKKYTQPQLFAILALRIFLKEDYRGILQILSEWTELRSILELDQLPDHSTLCYAEKRLLKKTKDFYLSYLNSLPLRARWKFPPDDLE